MVNHKKFDLFIAQYNTITNETIALKTLKDYMFSLPADELLAFMSYTQGSLFEHFDNQLSDTNQHNEVSKKMQDLEDLVKYSGSVSKAA